jgi:predicted SprT family Zn-dependent metalloprotease
MEIKQYGSWTVLEQIKIGRRQYYRCKCACGLIKEVRPDDLLNGRSKGCTPCRFKSKLIPIGFRVGKWTVLELVESEEKRKHYKVRCDCGFERILKGIRLNFGDSLQCRRCSVTKHGLNQSSTYKSWENVIGRCTNPNNTNFHHYGGRGITVCEEWVNFENFYKDMGDRPLGKEIDRINNNLGYFKENCRWVTHAENLKNRRR